MKEAINIKIENKLILEKRDLNVYHHAERSAHLISHDSFITLPLKSGTGNDYDYLHVSIVSGPGPLEGQCVLLIPSWIDFEFSTSGNISIIHAGESTFLKIPSGPPMWELRIIRPRTIQPPLDLNRIIVGDAKLEYQK